LWRLPVRRVIVAVFGEKPVAMPVGWSGSEPVTLGQAHFGEVVARGASRESIALHPPFAKGRVGTVLVEYPLQLPADRRIRLTFGNAIRDHMPDRGESPSDGVTFRGGLREDDRCQGLAGW
jgi:hypothetical protein